MKSMKRIFVMAAALAAITGLAETVSVKSPDGRNEIMLSDADGLARRKGEVWQIGAITGWKARTLVIDTAFLGAGEWEAEIFADAPEAGVEATHYTRTLRRIRAGERLTVELAPGGSWTARFVFGLHRTIINLKAED